jgi:pyruvate,water dikinase
MARSILLLAEATAERCGGKAAGLRRLLELGAPVPDGRCLPVELYREALGFDPRGRGAAAPGVAEQAEAALASWQPSSALRAELATAAAALGSPLIARSSASCEDGAVPSAGVFLSCAGLDDLDGLCAAIRRVWRSLWQPPAWAVLRSAGRWPGEEAMAVLLQRSLAARASGVLLSRDPGAEGRMRLELGVGPDALADAERDPELLLLPRRGPLELEAASLPLSAATLLALRDTALELERGFELEPGRALELEWLSDDEERLQLVQARATRLAAPPRSFPICFQRPGDAETRWRWDREHNPEPLSPMHASLIELLDERAAGPPRHLVLSGYLYQAIRDTPEPEQAPTLEIAWRELSRELDAALARARTRGVGADRLLELEADLDLLVELQARYGGGLGRARRAADQRLRSFLRAHGLELEARAERLLALGESHATLALAEESARLAAEVRRDPRLAAHLRAGQDPSLAPSPAFVARLAAVLERFGCLAQSWDVASPTLAEEPGRLCPRLLALADASAAPGSAHESVRTAADALARELARRLDRNAAAELERRIAEARLARELGEEDDLYFARALAVLRATLLACGVELAARGWLAAPPEVFLLELRDLLGVLRRGRPDRDLRAEAARRAASWEGSRELVPPLTIHGDRLRWPEPAPSGAPLLRGRGVGGVARGAVRRVERLDELLARPARGEVLVCATLLPVLALALPEAAALVTDHGGLLSHAASLARELGVPAVVGTGRATRELREGERVWVDGERGLVVRE